MNSAARVLVVEDDDTLREALCDTIEFGGYRALSAVNGLEALSRSRRCPSISSICTSLITMSTGSSLMRDSTW